MRIQALAVALGLFAVRAAAQDPAEENRVLKERLAAAEQRIDSLERDRTAQQSAAVANEVEEYLATAHPEVLAGSGALAGYDDGFFLGDAAGTFLLRLNGQLQVRFAANEQDESLGDPHRHGFEIPRAKLVASGHVLHSGWQYKIQGNFDVDGGAFTLEDAWVTYYATECWSFTVGQFKCPVLREEKVDSMYQLAVERSVVNDTLTSGERFGAGVAVGYARETWRLWGAFSDGDGTANTPALARETEYALTFRGELLLKGRFELFEDFTSFRDDEPGILLALNGHFQRDESGLPGPDAEVFLVSFDLSFEFGGANAFVEGIYVQLDPSGQDTREMFGFVAHGGFFVTETVEVFARYEFGDVDALSLTGDVSIGTIGVNRYIHRHKIKLTGDLGYAFDAVPFTTKYSDFRQDTPFADGQLVIRLQFQLLF